VLSNVEYYEYLETSKRLYDILIRPLEVELYGHEINTLVFILDGALRTIPMAALYDGNEFLINKFALATTLGLTLTNPEYLDRNNIEVLIAGLTKSTSGFSALEHVLYEIQGIQKLYKSALLKDEDFLIPSVQKELEETRYSIVHLASHGKFTEDFRKTFILAWDGKLTVNYLEKFLKRVKYRESPVALLTLSACETAAGSNRAAFGLASVTVKAGAKSAIATLWNVDDQASATVVTEFYKKLQDINASKAKALQEAQLKLIKDEESYQSHPYYWASFLLIGNWL
jgi:CHAT domain-containing protein